MSEGSMVRWFSAREIGAFRAEASEGRLVIEITLHGGSGHGYGVIGTIKRA